MTISNFEGYITSYDDNSPFKDKIEKSTSYCE